jgi:hypothetical protein
MSYLISAQDSDGEELSTYVCDGEDTARAYFEGMTFETIYPSGKNIHSIGLWQLAENEEHGTVWAQIDGWVRP